MTKLLAIDPGEHIGIAFRDSNAEVLDLRLFMPLFNEEHHPGGIKELVNLLLALKPDVIIYEDFNTAGFGNSNAKNTILVIGAIIAVASILSCKLVKQVPNNRYAFIAQSKLDFPKEIIHKQDAYAHLLFYEAMERSNAVLNGRNR